MICQTLKGLFKEMYDDYCTTNSTLDWSMDVYAPDLFKSRGLKVLLPGIYENVEVHIYYHNYSINTNKGMLKIEWQDKKIMQRVNTSLLLNGKQYYIFPENINQGQVFLGSKQRNYVLNMKVIYQFLTANQTFKI